MKRTQQSSPGREWLWVILMFSTCSAMTTYVHIITWAPGTKTRCPGVWESFLRRKSESNWKEQSRPRKQHTRSHKTQDHGMSGALWCSMVGRGGGGQARHAEPWPRCGERWPHPRPAAEWTGRRRRAGSPLRVHTHLQGPLPCLFELRKRPASKPQSPEDHYQGSAQTPDYAKETVSDSHPPTPGSSPTLRLSLPPPNTPLYRGWRWHPRAQQALVGWEWPLPTLLISGGSWGGLDTYCPPPGQGVPLATYRNSEKTKQSTTINSLPALALLSLNPIAILEAGRCRLKQKPHWCLGDGFGESRAHFRKSKQRKILNTIPRHNALLWAFMDFMYNFM